MKKYIRNTQMLCGLLLCGAAYCQPIPSWGNSTLVRNSDTGAVYVIQNGTKRLIRNPGLIDDPEHWKGGVKHFV